MTPRPLRFHKEAVVHIAAGAQAVFERLDDHRRLGAHMEKPSPMMAGAFMKIETDSLQGQALGSRITLTGRALLRVWIDYDRPSAGWSSVLTRLLGGIYAQWCVQRMAADAAQAFCGGDVNGNA